MDFLMDFSKFTLQNSDRILISRIRVIRSLASRIFQPCKKRRRESRSVLLVKGEHHGGEGLDVLVPVEVRANERRREGRPSVPEAVDTSRARAAIAGGLPER